MVMKEKDEELSLFLEMRRREMVKEKNNLLLTRDLDEHRSNGMSSPIAKIVSSLPARKTAADKFLNSENDKTDYDWLLTPPGTPFVPCLEMVSKKTGMSQIDMSNAHPTTLKSRLTNIEEPVSRANVTSRQPTITFGLNSSDANNRRPSSSEGTRSTTRSATPSRRPALPSAAKPARHSTPTSRATLPSSKSAAPSARSATPTPSTARSSTPTARSSAPVSKSAPRSATATRRSSTPSRGPNVAAPTARSSSVTKSAPTTLKNPVPSRGTSPTTKSRPWKPVEMPGFSFDAPPNLKTSLPERPASASRGRPATSSAQSSLVEDNSKGRPRRQSCSPSRGKTSKSSANGSGSSATSVSRLRASNSDDVNPVLIGTKMVERVVNMRKLAPPTREEHLSSHKNPAGKFSSSFESSGFGRTLSKKSLDMALRHMDIRQRPGNRRPLITNIPASSMYSLRSGSTKSRTISTSDSPHATRSNASSEPSVNNNSFCFEGSEREDSDLGSDRGNVSPASCHGR